MLWKRPQLVINVATLNLNFGIPSQNASPGDGSTGAIVERLDEIMSQLDDLNTALGRIATDADAQLAKTKELADELTALQNSTPPEVDLSGVIAKANAIADGLEGISAAAAPAAPTDQTQQDGGATA